MMKDVQKTWHDVVKECEEIVGCTDTAESPLSSNLHNIVRDLKVASGEGCRCHQEGEGAGATQRKGSGRNGLLEFRGTDIRYKINEIVAYLKKKVEEKDDFNEKVIEDARHDLELLKYGTITENNLNADVLINKLRHLINHVIFMNSDTVEDCIGRANKELDNYFENGGRHIEVTEGFILPKKELE